MIQLMLGDCLMEMNKISSNTVDLILTDPPYGTTACSWDIIPNLYSLWGEFKRVGKKNCAYVFTAGQPFTTDLINSKREWFKYTWVWDKVIAGGFNYARFQPMRQHEDIVVFYDKPPKYDAIGEPYDKPIKYKPAHSPSDSAHMTHSMPKDTVLSATHKRKRSIIRVCKVRKGIHPTEKPIELIKYLIKTYSNEGDVILDPFMGSGVTGEACMLLNRSFIGIEMDNNYFNKAKERIDNAR